jgi:hypothetical protein
MKKIK